MKKLIFLALFLPTLVMAGSFLTFQEYQNLSSIQKLAAFNAYKVFVSDVAKNEEIFGEIALQFKLKMIQEAIAAEKFDCFYAGWPSVKKIINVKGESKSYCTSPSKSNPAYRSLAQVCSSNQMLCQPLLFGNKVCIDVQTRSQKNSAFSQCQQKFLKSGKSLEDLSNDLGSDYSGLADEMFALVHDICESGKFQSSTTMCANLRKKIALLKDTNPHSKVANSPDIQVMDKGKMSKDEELKKKLVTTLQKVSEVPVVVNEMSRKVTCSQCEQLKKTEALDGALQPYEASEPIDQSKITPKDYCSGNQKGTAREKYSQGIVGESDTDLSVSATYQQEGPDQSKRIVAGYDVSVDKMGKAFTSVEDGIESTGEDYPPLYPNRSYSASFEGRGKEGVLSIVDSPVKEVYQNKKLKERYLSTDLRITEYSFFPRKNVPAIKMREGKTFLKLTTGEEVIIDSKSGRIVSGVAKEVPPKNQIEIRATNKRIYPDNEFSYVGDGLYIESRILPNKDEKKPGSVISVRAIVDGKKQECKLRSEEIWKYEYGYYLPQGHKDYLSSMWSCTRYKFETDEDFYKMIKKNCPNFELPSLAQ